MPSDKIISRLLKSFVFLGLVCAILSALEGRAGWVDIICSFWGNGCSEAAKVSVFGLPVSIWGIVYYAVLIVACFVFQRGVFYLVMAGAGVEIALLLLLATMKWNCLFCLANAVVMLVCLLLVFDRKRIWQTLALGSLMFIAAHQMLPAGTPQDSKSAQNPDDGIIVAEVGHDVIYQSELDEDISKQIYRLEGLKFQLRKKQLKTLIANRLLALEAGEKAMTPEAYKEQILSEQSQVTDEEVTNYLQNNPSVRVNWKGTEDELREDLRGYISEEKKNMALENVTKDLITKYPVKVLLPPPSAPVSSISIRQGSSPSMGPANAPVVVFEFSDYQCPTCRSIHKTSVDLRNKYEGKIRWVFKDFPLAQHQESLMMAQAARCAGEQSKFWEYQDFLYSSTEHPDTATLEGYAQKLNLGMDQFTECLESGKYKDLIEREKEQAKNEGISRTPTFIINGHMNPGKISYEDLSGLIESELRKKGIQP